MNWSEVGNWIKNNAGTGASLVGSLLTGNVPSAVAAGISLVSSATGSDNPEIALQELKSSPKTLLKLRELSFKEEDSIRQHIRELKRLELEDDQHSHSETQKTIRNGDNSKDRFTRLVRPSHATISLIAAIAYVFTQDVVNFSILSLLLTLPLSYSGLRAIDKTTAMFKTGKNT